MGQVSFGIDAFHVSILWEIVAPWQAGPRCYFIAQPGPLLLSLPRVGCEVRKE